MRLLIHSINHAPEPTATGKYTGEMAAWLAARGHEVRVVAAPPFYPEWRVRPGYAAWGYRREALDGTTVFRCPLYVPSRPSGFRRLPHLFSFALSSAPVSFSQAMRWRPDVVMVVEPTAACAPAALAAARLAGAKTWLHVQDFEAEAAFGLGMLPAARALAVPVLALDRFLTRRFDRVSTISQSMERRLTEKGVPSDRIVPFPNWVDTGRFRPDPAAGAAYRRKLGVSDRAFVVLYAGNMGHKQGLGALLDAAHELHGEEDVRFFLTGGGGERAALESRAAAMGLGNVRFLPLTPEGEMPALLAAADLHLVIQRRGAADLVMPSKLAPILAVGGRALVTADPDTELGRLAKENPGLYELVSPEDPPALARAVQEAARRRVSGFHAPARAFAEKNISAPAVLGVLERQLLSLTAD